jgi:hypothetical protein
MTASAQSPGRNMRRAASEYGAVSMGAVTIVICPERSGGTCRANTLSASRKV